MKYIRILLNLIINYYYSSTCSSSPVSEVIIFLAESSSLSAYFAYVVPFSISISIPFSVSWLPFNTIKIVFLIDCFAKILSAVVLSFSKAMLHVQRMLKTVANTTDLA